MQGCRVRTAAVEIFVHWYTAVYGVYCYCLGHYQVLGFTESNLVLINNANQAPSHTMLLLYDSLCRSYVPHGISPSLCYRTDENIQGGFAQQQLWRS